MTPSKANETPKIIALLAAIGVVLVFAVSQLYNANRPAETKTNVTSTPAILPQVDSGTASNSSGGTSGTVTPSNPTALSAKPGQMRQFDPVLDMAPEGSVPLSDGMGPGRANAFVKYNPPKDTPTVAALPKTNTNTKIANANGTGKAILETFNHSNGGSNGNEQSTVKTAVVVDNSPQQEITLDGVVTGTDGFAVLTVREPSRQNSAVPEQKRFVRLGDLIGDEKIVGITEMGLTLSKRQGTWAVGDKRGISRGNTLMLIAATGNNASFSAIDAKLPPTQTP